MYKHLYTMVYKQTLVHDGVQALVRTGQAGNTWEVGEFPRGWDCDCCNCTWRDTGFKSVQ